MHDAAPCSEDFANFNKLAYSIDPITVSTVNYSTSTATLGELCQPMAFIRAKDSSHPCRAVFTVQLMPG